MLQSTQQFSMHHNFAITLSFICISIETCSTAFVKLNATQEHAAEYSAVLYAPQLCHYIVINLYKH